MITYTTSEANICKVVRLIDKDTFSQGYIFVSKIV